MGRIGETLLAGSLLLAGAGAIGTAEYLHHESGLGQDARADACAAGLEGQAQIDCFDALAETQRSEQVALYVAGVTLMVSGGAVVLMTRERYPRHQSPDAQGQQPAV